MGSHSLEVTSAVIFDLRRAELISRATFDLRRAEPINRATFDLCHPFATITSAFRTARKTIKANVVVILDHGEKRNDILRT